jgi:phospholipase C
MSWNVIPEHLEGAARDAALSRREFLRRSAITAGVGLGAASLLSPGQVLAQLSQATSTTVPLGADMGIDHFVILMMENRSFDHYFGWLDPTLADASQHQTYADPTGKQWETRHAGAIDPAAEWQGCSFGDPGHGWGSGRAQLQRGFMGEGAGNDEFALSYYDKGDLGFIHAAAEQFNVYDKYFCSLLGPTWPNRYYKWSGQSGGRKDNSPPVETAGNQWDTIFDRALAERPNDVKVQYYNSDLPFSAVWGARGASWTRPIAQYYADCALGTLPNISIVDPPFRDGGGFNGNSADEHPMGDVRLGQAFMADVCHAFLNSPNFKRGALFVIYDEWGGFFDHVKPPKVADDRASSDLDEDFGQMGFRTPAVALSPYTLGTGVSHVGPLGHESILKLISQRFALSPLTTRVAQSVSIGESFDWSIDPNTVEVPDLPHPSHIVSRPCAFGGGDLVQDGGVHAGDMDGLEELAHRFKIPVGDGKPHDIFREPDSVKKALAASS